MTNPTPASAAQDTHPVKAPETLTAAPAASVMMGALLMVLATVCFVCLDATLKMLVRSHDVLFLSWARYLFQVVYLLMLLPFFGGTKLLRTRFLRVHMWRGALMLGSTVFIVLALKFMPMAQTYAITFSTPFLAVILSTVFLKETASLLRWGLIVLGFAGVMLAIQPQAPDAGLFLVFPLLMALSSAGFQVTTRAIGVREHPLTMMLFSGCVAVALTGVLLPWTWSDLTWPEWGLLAGGSLFGTMAHLLLTQALRLAPTSIVSPMSYAQIISAGLIGYYVFGETPTTATLLGGLVVVASGIALLQTKK
jgi:drug/metabolite transporter (DMT)-like permease